MKPPEARKLRVIVDECAGSSPLLLERFQHVLGPIQPGEVTFLSKDHQAIPDCEILHRLLGTDTVLLTRDRVLHNQACDLGFRSYFLDEQNNLRRRKLSGFSAPKPMAVRREGALKEDYCHPANPLAAALKSGFTERDFKRYRTRRRRIRSYFGSEAQVSSVSVTIGARRSRHGPICGYFLALSGQSGVKGIRASEGYSLVKDAEWEPAWCLLQALQELFLLQLENVSTELFIIPADALALFQQLLADRGLPAGRSSAEAVRTLLNGLKQVRALPCVKGRFFDAMESKLDGLDRRRTNELVPIEFSRIVGKIPSPATSSAPVQPIA